MATTDAIGFGGKDSQTHDGQGFLPFLILLDVSESMAFNLSKKPYTTPGPIHFWNAHLPNFIEMLKSNPSSKSQVHTKVVTFNHQIDASGAWRLPDDWEAQEYTASGTTALNEACYVGVAQLVEKIEALKAEHGEGVRVLRPTMMIVSDGLPDQSDHDDFHEKAKRRLDRMVSDAKFTVVSVSLGSGDNAEYVNQYLKALTPRESNALVMDDPNDLESLFRFASEMIDDVYLSSPPPSVDEEYVDEGEDISRAVANSTTIAPQSGGGNFANTAAILAAADDELDSLTS